MNVKDTRKTPERVRKCMGIRFRWEGLQGEGCGSRGERPCQKTSGAGSRTKKSGHDGSETRVRVGTLSPAGTRLGDRHKTGSERHQKNSADIIEHRNCDGKPEKPGDWGVMGNSISVERSLPPRVRRHDHVEGCSCLLNHRCCALDVWCLSFPSFMFFVCVQTTFQRESVHAMWWGHREIFLMI